MGLRILYRRQMNINFIIEDGTFIPFENSANREVVDKLISSVLPKLELDKADTILKTKEIAYNLGFTKYLNNAAFHYSGDGLKKFNEEAKAYAAAETRLVSLILDNKLQNFRTGGKESRHSDTLDFIIGVMLDANKSVKVNRLCFDHKNTSQDSHPWMKALGTSQWDDVEYQFEFFNPKAGLVSKLFKSDSAYQKGLSLRRSEIEEILANGDGTIEISTKYNTHVLSYLN
jgi:hypothetical protein